MPRDCCTCCSASLVHVLKSLADAEHTTNRCLRLLLCQIEQHIIVTLRCKPAGFAHASTRGLLLPKPACCIAAGAAHASQTMDLLLHCCNSWQRLATSSACLPTWTTLVLICRSWLRLLTPLACCCGCVCAWLAGVAPWHMRLLQSFLCCMPAGAGQRLPHHRPAAAAAAVPGRAGRHAAGG